jgi:hypothetical protein
MSLIRNDMFCTLHLRGGDVKVDFCDLITINPHHICWTVITKGSKKYATAKILRDGAVKNIYMHRLIMSHPIDVVDHIDRDGLNNRRNNLRVVTALENWTNSTAHARGKSKYKGVCWMARAKRWRASLQVRRDWKHLGTFSTEEDAARAYDAAVDRFCSEVAYRNRNEFPL